MLQRVVDLFKSKDRVLPEDSSRLNHHAREFSLIVCINNTISFETNTRPGRKGFIKGITREDSKHGLRCEDVEVKIRRAEPKTLCAAQLADVGQVKCYRSQHYRVASAGSNLARNPGALKALLWEPNNCRETGLLGGVARVITPSHYHHWLVTPEGFVDKAHSSKHAIDFIGQTY